MNARVWVVRDDRSLPLYRMATIVLTDMMMPGMDGLETIRAMQEVRPDLPAVLVSGLNAPSMSDAASELGVQHVLSKPFTITTLLKTLRDSLDQIPC